MRVLPPPPPPPPPPPLRLTAPARFHASAPPQCAHLLCAVRVRVRYVCAAAATCVACARSHSTTCGTSRLRATRGGGWIQPLARPPQARARTSPSLRSRRRRSCSTAAPSAFLAARAHACLVPVAYPSRTRRVPVAPAVCVRAGCMRPRRLYASAPAVCIRAGCMRPRRLYASAPASVLRHGPRLATLPAALPAASCARPHEEDCADAHRACARAGAMATRGHTTSLPISGPSSTRPTRRSTATARALWFTAKR